MFAQELKGWSIGKISLLFLCLFLLMPALLFAQAFPTKPINLLVTFRAGGATDSFARLLQNRPRSSWANPLLFPIMMEAEGRSVQPSLQTKT